jgi:hypothetical protein
VDPAGGLGAVGVDELDEAAFGVGEGVGLHEGDDDFGVREGGLGFGAGVEDEVVVGAGGDDGGVEDEGFVFVGGGEAGGGEDVGEQGAGVDLVGIAVGVVDVDGDLGHFEEVFHLEGRGAALEGDGEGVGGWDGSLFHVAGHGRLAGESEGREDEGGGEEGELHGDRLHGGNGRRIGGRGEAKALTLRAPRCGKGRQGTRGVWVGAEVGWGGILVACRLFAT